MRLVSRTPAQSPSVPTHAASTPPCLGPHRSVKPFACALPALVPAKGVGRAAPDHSHGVVQHPFGNGLGQHVLDLVQECVAVQLVLRNTHNDAALWVVHAPGSQGAPGRGASAISSQAATSSISIPQGGAWSHFPHLDAPIQRIAPRGALPPSLPLPFLQGSPWILECLHEGRKVGLRLALIELFTPQ